MDTKSVKAAKGILQCNMYKDSFAVYVWKIRFAALTHYT